MKEDAKAAAPTLMFSLKKGQYSDGSPLDEVHYLECKIILKPARFTSAKAFLDFGELVRAACRKSAVAFSHKHPVLKPQIREVLFLDTADFKLYKNAFILRRRTLYRDAFPVGDPEIVFKFRHPDIQKAAEMDVRPHLAGEHRVKFKAEALPMRDQIGGYRLLFSHNAQFGLSQAPDRDPTSMSSLVGMLPALRALNAPGAQPVRIVNDTIIEEVQQDLGGLDFGAGIVAEANVALWRERAGHRPVCGEFSFETKFKRGNTLHDKTTDRVKQLFVNLQQSARDWLYLGTTKTGLIYGLKGGHPPNQE